MDLNCPCCNLPLTEDNPRRRGMIINRRATINAELIRLSEMLAQAKKTRLSKQHKVTQNDIDERCSVLSAKIDELKVELSLLEKM